METTETKFGIDQITKQTPAWSKWVFRIVFILCTVGIQVVNGDQAIADGVKVRVCNYLSGASLLVYGISKMFGVNVKKENDTLQ